MMWSDLCSERGQFLSVFTVYWCAIFLQECVVSDLLRGAVRVCVEWVCKDAPDTISQLTQEVLNRASLYGPLWLPVVNSVYTLLASICETHSSIDIKNLTRYTLSHTHTLSPLYPDTLTHLHTFIPTHPQCIIHGARRTNTLLCPPAVSNQYLSTVHWRASYNQRQW